jgi:GT2 family glycosyltransferase
MFNKHTTDRNNLLIVFVPYKYGNHTEFITKLETNHIDLLFLFIDPLSCNNVITTSNNVYKLYKKILVIFKTFKNSIKSYKNKIIYGKEYSFHLITLISSYFNIDYYIENPKVFNSINSLNTLLSTSATVLLNTKLYEHSHIIQNACNKKQIKIINVNDEYNICKLLCENLVFKNIPKQPCITNSSTKIELIKNEFGISIVVLCFNKLNYTIECIKSVLKNTKALNYEVIIVNNNSSDNTKNYLDSIKLDNVIVVHNDNNYGFSKGMNIGVARAKYEYIILLNNDTVVNKNWDYYLINTLKQDSDVFGVMPITNYCGNEARVAIEHSSIDDFFQKIENINKKLMPSYKAESLNLFCSAFRREEFIAIGLLDENYNNGWEDDDLYERIVLQNKNTVINTQSIVYHHGNVTVGKNNYKNENVQKNKHYFEKKWNKKWENHWVANPLIRDGFIDERVKNKLWCHLHCFDIDKFDYFYKDVIDNILKYFSVVVTYSIGTTIPTNYNIHFLKIKNKGMDVGAKFKFIEYLKTNNIEYDYVLMLHSKSNDVSRHKYFRCFSNLNTIVKNIDYTVGSYVNDIIIQPCKNGNKNINTQSFKCYFNWDRNKIHVSNLIKQMDLPFYNNIFPEGNVYILKNEVANFIYDDRFNLYEKLNDETTFDYSWFVNYYNTHELTYDEAYDLYKTKNLYGNNLYTKNSNRQLRDCMIEHAFERIIFGVVKKMNLRANVLGSDESYNNKLNNIIYDITNNNNVIVISCHTSSELKIKSLINNINRLKSFSSIIYIINSCEFKGLIEKELYGYNYIINNNLTDEQAIKYGKDNVDLSGFNIDQLKNHYIKFGINEDRCINDSFKIYIDYVENDKYLCYSKYEYILNKIYDKYDNFLLTNDSILIINNINFNDINDKLITGIEMISMLESNDTMKHHPDFFRVYNKTGVKKWINHFNANKHKITTIFDCIKYIEIDSTYITDNRYAIFKNPIDYNGNIHFEDKQCNYFLENLKYPIIKIKKILHNYYQNQNTIPNDFDENEYLSLNNDLHGLNLNLREHFLVNGLKEGRLYKKNQIKTLPPYLIKFIPNDIMCLLNT